ncbi:MAG: tRNA (N6-isopentenyl adenosine(37)-C2)-methylthiotransferase MiaB [Bacteroidales bacterium]|nr:tRNA (N6-isopentenyl adenosine(37)-C2)-methylthiotransferase MiaB [Bacteroidales bacterium]
MIDLKNIYIETYGCQMNFSDSEIVVSILENDSYKYTSDINSAGVILINTCSIRDKAEQRIWKRINQLKSLKKKNTNLIIGVIGCMAERLKNELLKTDVVDLVAGPDAYRDMPALIEKAKKNQKASNVVLSEIETYDEIKPNYFQTNGVSAFISIMRGCQNFCTYCVVPYTRGKERSRSPESIINEAKNLFEKGYREVTLLGQNVNSYKWDSNNEKVNFAKLLESVALISPLLRVRFTTSHPKDISDELIYTIAKYKNICNYIHLPMQSGSTKILKLMNRRYTREWYMDRIKAIKRIIPDCSISTDVISGFCSETEEDHQDTLSLMQWVGYDFAYMFKYSERSGTYAAKKLKDDVPEDVKGRRLNEIIALQQKLSYESNLKDVGKTFEVLIEGVSKRSGKQFSGRNQQNKVVVFDKEDAKIGQYVNVKITDCTSATLIGKILNK